MHACLWTIRNSSVGVADVVHHVLHAGVLNRSTNVVLLAMSDSLFYSEHSYGLQVYCDMLKLRISPVPYTIELNFPAYDVAS
eukprot:m.1291147 g.1291147  ORF g.1291147 m.1291147 type:complete len:82 (-) comp24785_c1_seq1:6196-6441(-)